MSPTIVVGHNNLYNTHPIKLVKFTTKLLVEKESLIGNKLAPIEEDVRLTVDDLTDVHLCDILVIKLVPMLCEHVLTVRRVVTT